MPLVCPFKPESGGSPAFLSTLGGDDLRVPFAFPIHIHFYCILSGYHIN